MKNKTYYNKWPGSIDFDGINEQWSSFTYANHPNEQADRTIAVRISSINDFGISESEEILYDVAWFSTSKEDDFKTLTSVFSSIGQNIYDYKYNNPTILHSLDKNQVNLLAKKTFDWSLSGNTHNQISASAFYGKMHI